MKALSPDPSLLTLAIGGLDFLDPTKLIADFGHLGLILIIFAESCFAFFLPGDSLLFAAGFLSGNGVFPVNITYLVTTLVIAAVIGNQVGYLTGRRLGTGLFKEDSRFFKKDHLDRTHSFFEHHGPKTVVLARFIPIVRTFACIVAGAAKMDYRLFVTYNIVGALAWAGGLTVLGWGVARLAGEYSDVDRLLLPIIVVIVVLSFIPVFFGYAKAKVHWKKPAAEVRRTLKEDV